MGVSTARAHRCQLDRHPTQSEHDYRAKQGVIVYADDTLCPAGHHRRHKTALDPGFGTRSRDGRQHGLDPSPNLVNPYIERNAAYVGLVQDVWGNDLHSHGAGNARGGGFGGGAVGDEIFGRRRDPDPLQQILGILLRENLARRNHRHSYIRREIWERTVPETGEPGQGRHGADRASGLSYADKPRRPISVHG